ncbi:MAG TPA: aerotolerance regulator BatA [Bacteroidales bacterium]|nr:aerotolerance regulator BatA [Bacteroidales bacterium]
MWNNINFVNPEFFYILLSIPIFVVWYWFRYKQNYAQMRFSGLSRLKDAPKTIRQRLIHLPFVLKMIILALLIVVLTRPQSTAKQQNTSVKGIDIVMALDVSGSMLAQDLKPDRLEASKKVAIDFIEGRSNDRVGLIIFSGEAFTQCPLTTDHQVLKTLFDDVKSGMIEDGTAIGDGLATALARLKDSQAVTKVIILLTDGINNMGSLDASSAAEIAKLYGIRVYTIGVGTIGTAPYPVQTPFGIELRPMEVKIDEPLLKQIAATTDGKYFRATSNQKLQEIYKEIDELEKSKIDVTVFSQKKEEFKPYAIAALGFFIFLMLFKYLYLKTIP